MHSAQGSIFPLSQGVLLSAGSAVAPHSGNAVAEVIHAAQELAVAVGPDWGLAILVAILLFLPKYGVVVHLAALWKEDRADARRRKVETQRLESRYGNRSAPPALPQSRPRKEGK